MIKDSFISKALKNWAASNDIEQVVCYIGDYDHGGFCAYESVVEFCGLSYRIGIQFERKPCLDFLKNDNVYSIEELTRDW